MLKKKLGVFIAVVLTTLGLASVVASVTLALTDVNIDGANLELNLSMPANKFTLGEPIPFHFTLVNRGSAPLPFSGFVGLGTDMNVLVRNPNGTESRWEGSKTYGHSPSGFGTARPNEPRQSKSLLNEFKLLDRVFPTAGRYIIRVEFLYRSGLTDGNAETHSTASNAVELEIVDPVGRDREAYDFIVSRFVKNEEKFSTATHERDLKTFVDRYSDTVYAKYFAVRLASAYHVTGREQEAARELCKVSNENFYYSDQVQRELRVIDEKLHPTGPLPKLPENARIPVKPHPCTRVN